MKYKLNACPTLTRHTVKLKDGLKCMLSIYVSSQLLVLAVVPTNTENFKF